MSLLYNLRNRIIHFLYKYCLKPVFFLRDPEDVHDGMTKAGSLLGRTWLGRSFTSVLFNYHNPLLEQNILGITFKNPVGLAAGFDKNAQLTDILPSVGFGFEEVGSITGEPCEGNPKPRLWRLKNSKGLVVYYGLKNDGAEVLSEKLKNKKFKFPVGISIAKTNCKATCDLNVGVADYVKVYKAFKDIGDYYTLNISCPNTYGGEPFIDGVSLNLLLHSIEELPKTKPVFIKLSPDLTQEQIDTILTVAGHHKVDGFIVSNLTKKRDNPNIKPGDTIPEKGGMSGKVVEDLSNKLIKYIYTKTHGTYIIIGCGGIMSAEDAYKKILLGASLLQMITGMIFEGPQVISEINRGLVALLKRDGYSSITEAVGKGIDLTPKI